jgi:hypothetical protein
MQSEVRHCPVVRIVFDDIPEFVELQNLALALGMGSDWPKAMLLYLLESFKDSEAVFHVKPSDQGG